MAKVAGNFFAQDVRQRTSAPLLSQQQSFAQGIAQAGQNVLQSRQQMAGIAEDVANLAYKWQQQYDNGQLAKLKVQSGDIQAKYLESVSQKKGENAKTDEDSWQQYQSDLQELLNDLDGISGSARDRGLFLLDDIVANTSQKESLYNVSEQRKAAVDNEKAAMDLTVQNVAGAVDKGLYMKDAQESIDEAVEIIYPGRPEQQKLAKVEANSAMYKEAVMSVLVNEEDPEKAWQMMTDDSLEAFSESNIGGQELLSTQEKRTLRDAIQKKRDQDVVANATYGYTTQISKGLPFHRVESDIERRVQEGELSPKQALDVISGVQSAVSRQKANEKERENELFQEMANGFVKSAHDGVLTKSQVLNHPNIGLADFRQTDFFLKLAESLQPVGGRQSFDTNAPETIAMRLALADAISKKEVRNYGDLNSFRLNYGGQNISIFDVPASVTTDAMSRLGKAESGAPNYVDAAKLGMKFKKGQEDIFDFYINEYIYRTGIDEYDKAYQKDIEDFATKLSKNLKDPEAFTEYYLEQQQIDRQKLQNAPLAKRAQAKYPVDTTDFSESLSRNAVSSGQSWDNSIKQYAQQNGWSSVSFDGGLGPDQDAISGTYNTVGHSYGVDPNILAAFNYVVNEQLGDILASGGRTGIMGFKGNSVQFQDGTVMNYSNPKDSVEALAKYITEGQIANPTASIEFILAGIIKGQYTSDDEVVADVISNIFDNINGMRRKPTFEAVREPDLVDIAREINNQPDPVYWGE